MDKAIKNFTLSKLKSKNQTERKRNKNIKIVISSNNDHKIKEYKDIFSKYPNVEVCSLKDMGINVDPEENGKTFKENSLIKATAVANETREIVIADDSGLEIDALDGFPGIYSSRFMEGEPYVNKFSAIFNMLKEKETREAQFHCVITVVHLDKDPLFFEGVIRGEIATKANGDLGFGYDPIFIPSGYNKSFADLSNEEKNAISHRGIASKKLLNYLISKRYI